MDLENPWVIVVIMHDHGMSKRIGQHEQEFPIHEDKPPDGIS